MTVIWVWRITACREFLHAVMPALSRYPEPQRCEFGAVVV